MKTVAYQVQEDVDTYTYTCSNKPSATSLILKRESSGSCSSNCHTHTVCRTNSSSVFGRTQYKLWALIVILLLAFWSMFTGSVTLNWSYVATSLADDFDSPLQSDLDILEVEEREKVVRRMWDVYTHSKTIRLPKFWQRAFEAAYEDLISDVSFVRDAAVSEVAKMSLLSLDLILESQPQSTTASGTADRSAEKETRPSKLQKATRRLLHFPE